jgi:hypothetical protein
MRSVHCAADTPCSTPITGVVTCCARCLRPDGSRAAEQRDELAAFLVEMLCVYCRDAELFASDAAAGLPLHLVEVMAAPPCGSAAARLELSGCSLVSS